MDIDAQDRLVQLRDTLVQRLGQSNVLTEPADQARYCRDWHGDVQSGAVAVLRPDSTEAVARAVRACGELGLAIIPQGGNTGLVLGGTPDAPAGQVVLSLERMNRIRRIDADDFSAVVEAGCVLQQVQDAARDAGLFLGLSLGAEGSCHVGGNVSTNAGGINVLRYGMTRELIFGLEVVLPDGSILDGLSTLRKDNRGIDLKQLFIGAEGTLGVVTAATLKLFPIMRSRAVAVVGLETAAAAIELLARAKAETGGGVEAFELMKRLGLALVLKNIPDTREPLDSTPPWIVLIEIASGQPGAAEAQMERLLEVAFEEGLISDAAIAQSDAQRAAFWRLREEHSAGLKPEGGGWKHDVSVPISRIADFIDEAKGAVERFHPGARCSVFGHVGDGNLHYDVLPGEGQDVAAFIGRWMEGSRVVHDVVARYDGSISAEHGLGRLKTDEARRYKSPVEIATMAAVRQALDPQRIMNPGVLF